MKKILCSVVLLYLCSVSVKGQSLTLDQLIYLDGLEQLSCDSYLAEHGWRFTGTKNINSDSVSIASWTSVNANGIRVSLLNIREALGQKREITYLTSLRAPFDAIRDKVNDYRLEQVGTGNENGLQSYYRGAQYNIMLGLTTYNNHPNYMVVIARHGLVKGFRQNDDGTTEDVWVDLSTMEPERAQQLKALVDSVDRENRMLQAEGRAQRAATSRRVKGSRK